MKGKDVQINEQNIFRFIFKIDNVKEPFIYARKMSMLGGRVED